MHPLVAHSHTGLAKVYGGALGIARAMLASGAFERRFRDVHSVTQQYQGRQDHYETVGQFLLGIEPDLSLIWGR